MTDQPYSKREDDAFRIGVKTDLAEIKEAVAYTNGKVKKIILVLVALGFYVLGVSNVGIPTIIKMFI